MDYIIGFLDKVIKKAKSENISDDQEALTLMYLDYYNLYGKDSSFKIDNDCQIFQVLWDENFGRSANFDVVYNRDRIYNKLTNTDPCIFHAPGPTTTLSQVWKIINNKYNYIFQEKKLDLYTKNVVT